VDSRGERGLVADVAGSAVCTLPRGEGVNAHGPQFLPGLGLLWWTESSEMDDSFKTTRFARPDCQLAHTLPLAVDYAQPLGARGLALGVRDSGSGLTISYAPALDDHPLDAALPLFRGVDGSNIGAAGPSALVAGTGEGDPLGVGLFAFGSVP
jgi:hypothetical protein